MSEATRVLIRQLIRLAKGMITAVEVWLAAQEAAPTTAKDGRR
jgi:hypothetical protein